MKDIGLFISLLTDVIGFAKTEEAQIKQGKASKWSISQLHDIILPEMCELLTYANKGKVYFKYGKKQRMLLSTYLLTDSLENLNKTELGSKISKLQQFYNSL